jgi:hypothetical protein
MNLIQIIKEIILFNIKSITAGLKLYILSSPYLNEKPIGSLHVQCSCGYKSKKYLIESPVYKAWLREYSDYLNSTNFEEWKVTCFCGKEKINK